MEREIIYFLLKCKFVDNIKLQMEVQAFQEQKMGKEYFVNFLRSRNIINDDQYKLVLMAKSVADKNVLPLDKIVILIYKYLQLKPKDNFLDWLTKNKIIELAPTKPIVNTTRKMGRYQIIDKIGQGGMGDVFKAFDPYIKRHVAIKVLKQESSTERFLREVEICGKLKHQNIVNIYDIGKENDQCFFVMDFIEGKTLSDIIEENKLSNLQMMSIMEKIARAVSYAHEHNIIHRDIKPQNIMVDSQGEPKILDFGLAKLQEPSELTTENQTIGTVFYMAPEQIDNKYGNVSYKTDIYALGVVLYCCLARTLPFNGINTVNVINKILYEEPTPISEIDKEISSQLENICRKAMEKNVAQRYHLATEFADDLQAYILSINTTAPNKKQKTTSIITKTNIPKENKSKRSFVPALAVAFITFCLLLAFWIYQQKTELPQISYRKVILNKGGAYTLAARDEIEIVNSARYLYVFAKRNNQFISLYQYFITPETATSNFMISSTSVQYDEDWYLYPSQKQLELKTVEKILGSFQSRGLKNTDIAIEKKGNLQWRIFNVVDDLELDLLGTFHISPQPFALEMYVRKKQENVFVRLEKVDYVTEGDELQIRVFAHEKMYHLAIFFRDSQGNVGQVFPSQQDAYTQPFSHYYIDSSKQQYLPHQNSGFEFDHNRGEDHILCFFDESAMNCQELLQWVKTTNLNPTIGSNTRGLIISSPKLYQVSSILHK